MNGVKPRSMWSKVMNDEGMLHSDILQIREVMRLQSINNRHRTRSWMIRAIKAAWRSRGDGSYIQPRQSEDML